MPGADSRTSGGRADFDAARQLYASGHRQEASELLRSLQATCDPDREPSLLGATGALLAEVLVCTGRPAEACWELLRAREIFAAHDKPILAAICDHNLAVVLHGLGDDIEEAEARLRRARATFLAARRGLDVASCDFNLAIILHDTGRLDDAVERYVSAREIFRARRRWADAAACNQNLGGVLCDLGRYLEAHGRLDDAGAAYHELGDAEGVKQCRANLARLEALIAEQGGGEQAVAAAPVVSISPTLA